MVKKICSLILIVAFIFNVPLAFAAEALSLDSVLKEAREHNPEILAAKKRYEASQARVPQARSLEDPNLGLAFQYTPGSPFQFNRTPSQERALSISQFLPFFGKLSLKGKIALVESQMLAAEYKNRELEVVNQVRSAYYDLFMNYREIELNKQGLILSENIEKIIESKYSTGDMSQQEVYKILLEVARLKNTIANLETERLSKETRISTLLNRDPEAPVGAPDLGDDVSFHSDIRSLYQAALLDQPDLIIFSYAIEKNKYAASLAKRSYFPDVMATIAERGITSGTIGPWDLMLAFTVPLWFWTKQRYQVKEAIANVEEARAAYKAMQNKAFAEVKDLAAKIEVAKNKAALSKTELIPIIENSIEVSLAALRTGKLDVMTLLDSQRILVQEKMNYYKALVDYNMNLADLKRAVGTEIN